MTTFEKPKVRKLMDNPFEQKKTLDEDASKKSVKGIVSNGQNRISEMKKRYSQLSASQSSVDTSVASQSSAVDVSKASQRSDDASLSDAKTEIQVEITEAEKIAIQSPAEPKEESGPVTSSLDEKPKLSLLRRSKEQLDRSCDKLFKRFSRERLNEPARDQFYKTIFAVIELA